MKKLSRILTHFFHFLITVFDPTKPAPVSLDIVAYRPHWPTANGNVILSLVPVEGWGVAPAWSSKLIVFIKADAVKMK